MKKLGFTGLLLLILHGLTAQLNNEWIDYTKQYFKIKIAAKGFYRLSKSTLDAAGLGNTEVQKFQLWRNGNEVPLYTSITSGSPGAEDYIEFYGEKNDGKIDHGLYRVPADHLTDKVSLFTDTAIYFLTINTTSANLRYQTISNDLSGSLPPPATHVWALSRFDYFNGTNGRPYVNKGFAQNYGEYVYSSAYDKGEMLSCLDIYPNQNGQDLSNKTAVFANLSPYTGDGLNAKMMISLAGNAPNVRNVRVMINTSQVADRSISGFEAMIDTLPPLSPTLLSDLSTIISVQNLSTNLFDRVVAGFVEIDYPRLPDGAGLPMLSFYLPAGNSDTYLDISNFANGGVPPVLYNLTSGQRMVGALSGSGNVRLLIPASNTKQEFVLVSQATNGYRNVGNLKPRSFVNYTQAANQADYVIITNRLLWDGGANNPVEQYRQYRNSATGGAYNAKIYDIEELVDQFAYGVKMHPLAVKNFLRYLRKPQFTIKPRYCFLIGKGVAYDDYRANENKPVASQLELVPTFGYPASDNLLASDDLTALTATFIGRLNVVYASEVTDYLDKVKEYDAAQANPSQSQEDKAWMKNIVHVVGANDQSTASLITPYMEIYKRIIQDTLFGGSVTTFNKFNTTTASTIENEQLAQLFKKGLSQLTYFGHSSATALDYNLDDPSQYDNPGKYPMFMLLGCNAGNFFDLDTPRLQTKSTISEKYILAKNRGAIGMIASTHFGIVNGLGLYSNGYYQSIAYKSYNQTVGQNIHDAIENMYKLWSPNDFSARIHTEQQTLHGDPAIRVNAFAKPDYSVEASNVFINPTFLSIAETNFKVKVYHYNLGKAINDSIIVEVKRQYPVSDLNPNGLTETVYHQKIKAPLFIDSLEIPLSILPERDKGINKIIVSLETENRIDELSETNNNVSTDVVIYEDELRPVYPYNYAIITKQGTKLIASTSNQLSTSKLYRMELDTTALFNSPAKITQDINTVGGVVEFDPGITYSDSTVYYWRLAVVPSTGTPERWNNSSFIYLQGTETGFNQSHLYQHTKSITSRINIDSTSRIWQFGKISNNLFVTHSVYNTPGYTDDLSSLSITLNSRIITASACVGHSLIFNVFHPITLKPLPNYPGGAFGSGMNNCQPGLVRANNFEWDDRNAANRNKMRDFMDSIPDGSYVVVRKILDDDPRGGHDYTGETYAPILKQDQQVFGVGNTLYDKLKSAGFSDLDSFNRPRIYIFVYKKNDASFQPRWILSDNQNDGIQMTVNIIASDTLGYITSPLFGPAKSWKQALWRGNTPDNKAGDNVKVNIIGVNAAGAETPLYTLGMNQQDFDISQVNAGTYPFLKLQMRNADSINGTPYNLRWWRLYYDPVPEGALAGNILLEGKDTLNYAGEPYKFRIAFKNISPTAFPDSLRLKVYVVTDKSNGNITKVIDLPRKKPLISGDTAIVAFTIDTKTLPGLNTLYVAVNPDNDQPEQQFFNNFLYKNFYVREDTYNPLLDVTFDGNHILNEDIVSAKPHIQIKLKDENQFLVLNDTAGLTIKLKYPSETDPRMYQWNTDTLSFTPATNPDKDNTATIDFTPVLNEDSDGIPYEMTVSGKDRIGNKAGNLEYRISFKVFNKPMISNLLNYPNPFTTSTSFVFTITGSEIPQEFKIQILSITGKIVKEITRQELGNLHIGTNITEYKWDGTDTYGQKLGNGVYLYRVISSLDGNKMDKFHLNDGYDQNAQDATDKYFKKGYGKMVILR